MLFCFPGTGLGTGLPPSGPPPHPGPAVDRDNGLTALHWAAYYGNRRIVRSLVAFNADVNAQDRHGCAVCACGESAVECGRPSRRRRLPCRYTPLHEAASDGCSASVAELLLRGADVNAQNRWRCAVCACGEFGR